MRYETFIAVKQKVIIHFPPNRHSFGSPTLSSLSSRETSMSLCLLPRLRRCSRKGAGALTLPTRTTNTREASASMWLLCRLLSSDRPSSWYGFRHMTEYYRVLQSITETNLAHLLWPIFGLVYSAGRRLPHFYVCVLLLKASLKLDIIWKQIWSFSQPCKNSQ